MNSTTLDTDGKFLLVALFECCVRVFICPNMVVMAADNNLSSEGRGGLRVCGALGQCSVRGPRALKNVVGCVYVLEDLLLFNAEMSF
jgi:hypothetical protein